MLLAAALAALPACIDKSWHASGCSLLQQNKGPAAPALMRSSEHSCLPTGAWCTLLSISKLDC